MKVTRKCAHVTEFEDAGMVAFERDEKRQMLSRTECPDCDPRMKAKRAAERSKWIAEQEQRAIEAEKQMRFDPLRGSDKQVSWGRRVRVELVSRAFHEGEMSEQEFDEKVATPANKVTSASWWISHAETSITDLPQVLALALDVPVNVDTAENPFK